MSTLRKIFICFLSANCLVQHSFAETGHVQTAEQSAEDIRDRINQFTFQYMLNNSQSNPSVNVVVSGLNMVRLLAAAAQMSNVPEQRSLIAQVLATTPDKLSDKDIQTFLSTLRRLETKMTQDDANGKLKFGTAYFENFEDDDAFKETQEHLKTQINAHVGKAKLPEMNAWVAKMTNDKIKDLFKSDVSRALVSTTYIKQKWLTPFDPAQTLPGDFHASRSEKILVDKMHRDGQATQSLRKDGKEIAATMTLPFTASDIGQQLDAQFFLPSDGQSIDTVLQALSRKGSTEIVDAGTKRISLPKLQIKSATPAPKESLMKMGVTIPKKYDSVVEEGFLGMDEFGSELGIASTLISKGMSQGLNFDRPYLIVFKDREGNIVAATKVQNPNK